MSMLQQILDQMFVDPEILNALDEEQKQILFIKMREEQVKRWEAFEMKRMQNGEPESSKPKDNSRRVSWLTGEDGEVWVWVMGEHKDDLTIEQITEKRALEEARQLAEKEMLENMRLTELSDNNAVVGPHEDENTLKEQLSRIRPWNSEYACNKIQESVYDDADTLFGSPKNNVEFPAHIICSPEPLWPRKGILKKSNEILPSNNNTHIEDKLSSDIHTKDIVTEKTCSLESFADSLKSNGSDERSQILPSTSTPNSFLNETFIMSPSSNTFSGNETMVASHGACTNYAALTSQSPGSDIRPIHGLGKGDVRTDCTPYEMKRFGTPPNAANSNWMNGNSSTGIVPAVPRSRLWKLNTQITPPQKMNCGDNSVVKFRPDFNARHDLSDIDEEITKRQSEIFEKIKEKHQQFDREAAQEAERAEQAWEEQERKAREAEAQIRRIAQRAREQHRQQSLRTSSSILPFLKNTNASFLKGTMKSVPRPPKPKSREAIINWFKAEELLRGTGLDPITRRPAVWFHGIIRRSRADQLLQKKPSGSFLVRVSERIWGYTISYVVGDGNVKHFLVERIPQGYQFLGTNQIVHKNLHELVAFHEISPITVRGNEILRWAVGQVDINLPDYADLIPSE